jgi:hypothetical protein
MTMAKDDEIRRSSRDAHSALSKLSLEDTNMDRARLKRAPSAFDPYAGALPAMPPTTKKDLRKLGEWIKAKRTAEELKRQEAEQLVPRPKNPERP